MKVFLFPLLTLLLSPSLRAQESASRLNIKFNKTIFQPGDSLSVLANYKGNTPRSQNQSLATLELIIENEAGQRTRLRWPVINGQAAGSIFLPDSLPTGRYTLFAGLQERFFEVVGQISDAGNISSIQALLLTKNGDWDEQQVAVDENGSFAIRNWLFEDNALLAFQQTGNNNRLLDIRISTRLDSSYRPLAATGPVFYVGNPPAGVRPDLERPIETPETIFEDRGTLLPAVIVRSTTKTPARQFSDEYVSGLFRSDNERTISIMEDPAAMGFTNVLNYLQGRVAGLQISPSGAARWRGGPVTFFLNEMRVSAQQIATIPMPDIAIVKAYPPPFFGAPGGNAGVAVYTRRGGEANYLPVGRQVFRVRGYSSASTVLDMDKLRL